MLVVHVARKPLSEPSVAANVLRHGTGAINVDACRIGSGEDKGEWPVTDRKGRTSFNSAVDGSLNNPVETDTTSGRWPANLILQHRAECQETCDPRCPVAALDSQTNELQPSKGKYVRKHGGTQFLGQMGDGRVDEPVGWSDAGGASRFFKQV